MSQSSQENVIIIDYDLAQDYVTQDNGKLINDYLMGKPQDTMENPRLQKEVLIHFQSLNVSFNALCGFQRGTRGRKGRTFSAKWRKAWRG